MKYGNILRCVSVDPGSNLGLCCFEIDVKTKQMKVLDAHTLHLTEYTEKEYPEMVVRHGMVLARLMVLKKLLSAYLNTWGPTLLIHETAFLRAFGRFAGSGVESFASLRENILAIKLAGIKYDEYVRILEVNPNSVKMAVPGVKSKDKSQIIIGLKTKDNLDMSSVKVDLLDEHGVDAIAIGYTAMMRDVFGEGNEHLKRSKRARGNKNKSTRRRVAAEDPDEAK